MYSPRHWPTWLGVGLFNAFSLLPVSWQRALGRALGRLMHRVGASRRRITRANLERCLPGRSPGALDALTRESFVNLGESIAELLMAWRASERDIDSLAVDCIGLEPVREALDAGRGALVFFPHWIHIDLIARLLVRDLERPIGALYRRHHNPVVERWQQNGRERVGAHPLVPQDQVRTLVRILKRGGAMIYLPDQDYGPVRSAQVPFFGVPVRTTTAPAEMLRLTGALPFVMSAQRRRDVPGYRIELEALDIDPTLDAVEMMTRINLAVEKAIRTAPTEYLWQHDRFKRSG